MARGNRLLNRVKRHAETTTLFRQRDTAVATPPAARQPMPQATVHAGLENLPLGEVIGLPPLTAVPHTPAPLDNLADTLITRPQPNPPTPPKTTGQPAAPLARQPQPAAAPPANDPDDNDPTWRRLSTIMRKHEEKQAAEEAAEAAGAEAAGAERGETHPPASKTPPDISRQLEKVAKITADSEPGIDSYVAADRKAAASHSEKVASKRELGDSPTISRSAEPVGTYGKEGKTQEADSLTPPGDIKTTGPTEDVQQGAPVDKPLPDNAQIKTVISREVSPAESKNDAGEDVTMVSDLAAGSPIQATKEVEAGEPTREAATTAVHPVAPSSENLDKTAPTAKTSAEPPTVTIKPVTGDAPVSRRPGSDPATEIPESIHLEEAAAIGGWPGSDSKPAGQNKTQSAPEIRSGSKADETGSAYPPVSDSPRSSVIQTKADDARPPARPPLEAAWPVERREAADIPPPPPPVMEPILPRHTPENAQVASVLQAVAAERPSGSSVEIIPPRRPRPTNAPTLIQRAPEKAAPPSQPNEPKAEKAPPANGETVPTRIGPLPADLWQLIGEEPPTVMRAAVSETQTEPQRVTAAERPSPAPERPQTQSAAIQATAVTDQSPASTDAESETNNETAEPDVDELARRVYSEIKRKLSVEWERMRGRKW